MSKPRTCINSRWGHLGWGKIHGPPPLSLLQEMSFIQLIPLHKNRLLLCTLETYVMSCNLTQDIIHMYYMKFSSHAFTPLMTF